MGWSELDELPAARAGRAVAVGDIIHVLGGRTTSTASSTDHLVFDGSSWSSAAALPSAIRSGPVAELGGIIYVASPTITGDASGDLWAYDPGTDTWDTGLAAATQPIRYLAALGGLLYAVGESSGTLTYDPGTDTWTTLGFSAPWAGPNGAMTALDGQLWLLGGDAWWDPSPFWVFHPSTGWDSAADFPAGRENMGMAAVDGLVHVVGGWRRADPPDEDDLYQAAVEHWTYDPTTDAWSPADALGAAAALPATAVTSAGLHVLGGIDGYLPGSSAPLVDHVLWEGTPTPSAPGAGWRLSGSIGWETVTAPPPAPASVIHWHNEWVTFDDNSSGVLTVLDSIDPNDASLSIIHATWYYVDGFVAGHTYEVTAESTGVSDMVIHCYAGDNPFASFHFAGGAGTGTFEAESSSMVVTITAVDAAEPPPAVGTGTVTFIDLGPA